jgi:protein O-GlcNAc transferase
VNSGKNDLCPCGSGGAYQKCCGRHRVEAPYAPPFLWPKTGATAVPRSIQYQNHGQFDESAASYRRVLEIKPDDAQAHHNLGIILHQLGRFDEAEASYRLALQIKPDYAVAHNNLGVTLQELGRLDEAEASYRRALQIEPDDAKTHYNLGNTLQHLDRLGEAEASYRRTLQIKPDHAEAQSNLGIILHALGNLNEAEASCRRALQIKPDHPEAHNSLGIILQELGRLEEAEASYRRMLQIRPDYAEAHGNLGNTLQKLGRLEEAETSYRRILQIKPDSAEAQCNLGNILQELGRLGEAVASYCRALEIKPDFADAHSNLLFTHNYLADQPAATLQAEARRFGDLVAQKASPYEAWRNAPEPGRCLRVGLVSGDFRIHPVGYFIESVLAALASHASGRLELIAYSTNIHADDALTGRIKACCRGWHTTVGLSDAQLAQRIYDDGIDILIDLSGHTGLNRLPMFAWKPAPVQASWLGYFATTGVAAMDYLIADPWTLPEAEEAHFTETIWQLPETRLCFTPPDVNVDVSPLPASANGIITFGCFNNLNKMNHAVVALWAKILHATPESRLFLKAKQLRSTPVRQSVLERFAAHGIAADRLILEGSSPRQDYLAAYGRVDIALDPFPYTGGATTSEALWMGVPVLTLAGEHFLARQGVGLLANAGLPEWIAADANDYVARAVAHAGDLPLLAVLRAGLRQQVLASPIFDAPRFARHFEAALRGMWTTWCDRQQGSRDEAVEAAAEPAPSDARAHCKLGYALQIQGRLEEAGASYRHALQIEPNDALAYYNLGSVLQEQDRLGEAAESYRQALHIKPDFTEAHCNLGNTLQKLGRLTEAESSCRHALQFRPDFANAHYNLGNVLQELGRLDEAVASFLRALQIEPDFAKAHYNLGVALQALARIDDAVANFRQTLRIEPDFAEAHCNLGSSLQDLGLLDEALASYRRALEIKPDLAEAHSNVLFVHNYLPDQPATMLLAEARRFGDLAALKARPFTDWRNVPEAGRRLRIGLVSGDFRTHPVGYFVESVLASLASNAAGRLELITYSNHVRADARTERIKACCHGWHAATTLSDAQLAQRVRDDGIDILIDLSGHTAFNRLSMFAWKPAPVQASWLDYFATTGITAIDYLIADPWTLPEAEEASFTEKIWRLPETRLCFTPPDVDIDVSPLPALANGTITFGCFNNLSKMNDAVVALWARVLHAVPRSRLFLKAKQLDKASVQHNVIDRFAMHGIGPDRLILESHSPRLEYLSAYHRVDIALDPFPFPGGTVSVEALWMGVPVLTLTGERFLSRQGVGLLMNAGLPEWIAADADDYVARAVAHAGDLPRLAALRQGLRQQALASPIFDAPRFAAHFEAALRDMWTTWCNQTKQRQ